MTNATHYASEETYSHAELLAAYKMAEQGWLRGVFREDYSTKLTTYDLLDHLACQAEKYGFEDNNAYVSLRKGLRNFSFQYGALINGERGERFARRALSWLKVPHETVENIVLDVDGQTNEYDQIVITPTGVFVIEVKYSTSDTIIDTDGYLRGHSWKRCKPYNVGERIRNKEHVLWQTLEGVSDGCLTRDRIHGLLLFSNNSTEVVDNFGKVEVLCCGNVNYYIEEFNDGMPALTASQMAGLKNAIEANGVEATYRAQVDLNQIREDYIEVMKLINAESANCDVYADTYIVKSDEKLEKMGGLERTLDSEKSAEEPANMAAMVAAAGVAVLGVAGIALAAIKLR